MRMIKQIVYLSLIVALSLSLVPRVSFSQEQSYIYLSRYDGSSWTTTSVVAIDYANATRNTQQRKVFKDEAGTYFIFFYNQTCQATQFVSSTDAINWQFAVNHSEFGVYPYSNLDIQYPCRLSEFNGSISFSGSNGVNHYWKPFNITDVLNITEYGGGSLGAYQLVLGSSLVSSLDGVYDFMIFHRNGTGSGDNIRLQRSPANSEDSDTTISYGDGTSGGNKLLNYKTSSPYHMIAIVKGNNQILYWNLVNRTDFTFNDTLISKPFATLGVGFNDWCATTEATGLGATEKLHLTFVNSTGLFYMSFESDSWSGATNLGVSGATYPTIAVDDSADIIVMYVRANFARCLVNDGSWGAEGTISGVLATPEYLSSNQNEQNNEILLVWVGTPYSAPEEGELTQMINVFAVMLPVAGVVLGLAFVILALSMVGIFSSRGVDYDVGIKLLTVSVFCIIVVGMMLLVMAYLNTMIT